MPGGGGILSTAIEHSGNPAEPIEAYALTRRLMELYPGRLYLELAFHGNAAEKLVNRGLIAIAQRMELPLRPPTRCDLPRRTTRSRAKSWRRLPAAQQPTACSATPVATGTTCRR
jgi:hypothetical protein